MEVSNFELTIYSRKYWLLVMFLVFVLLLIAGNRPYLFDFVHIVSNLQKSNQWFFFLLFYYFSFNLFQEIAWLTGKAKIEVDSETLIVTLYFFGISFIKKYSISKTSNFAIKHKVPGGWYLGRSSYYGIPLIKDPTVLYFDYEGDTKSIGSHLQDFPAETVISAVKRLHK